MYSISDNRPEVFVIDIDHINGIQTSRIFAERGVKVTGIASNPSHFCARTNSAKTILKTNTKNEELISTLVNSGRKLTQKAILVPCQDQSVYLISKYREELLPYYQIALPPHKIVDLLMDKPSFYEFARKEKLPVANFFILNSISDAKDAAEQIKFPAVLKPHMKSVQWAQNTIEKAFKVFDKKEFFDIYNKTSGWTESLMIQEWVAGEDTDLYSCNCYFNSNSDPLVSFVAKKLRQFPIETGNTSLGIDCIDDNVKNITLDLFRRVNYFGLGYVEIKKDSRTGNYFIIEPNIGRPTGRSALAEACGVEILYTMYSDLTGLPLPDNRKQVYKGIKWIHLRTDLQSSAGYWKKGKLKFGDWLRSIRGKKHFAVFSLKDPIPFLEELRFGLVYSFKTLLNKFRQNHGVTESRKYLNQYKKVN